MNVARLETGKKINFLDMGTRKFEWIKRQGTLDLVDQIVFHTTFFRRDFRVTRVHVKFAILFPKDLPYPGYFQNIKLIALVSFLIVYKLRETIWKFSYYVSLKSSTK